MGAIQVLVVEDEPIIRDLIVDFLEGEGIEAASASDGHQALDIAIRDGPDLILLDMMLPGLDGVEVARRLRRDPRTQRTPVIAMSADARTLRQASSLPLDGVLPKPFNLLDLLDMITANITVAAKPS